MVSQIKIENLESKQPLFQEFCKINNLKNNDYYKPVDYIFWCDTLTLIQQLNIVRKYNPNFKLKTCNL